MKNKVLIIVFICCFAQIVAQQKIYILRPSYSQKVTKKSQNIPYVYEVVKNSPTNKVIKKNQTYLSLKKAINQSIKDSIQTHTAYETSITRYQKVKVILRYIDTFISSQAPYDESKKNLISAQKIANLQRINELIYADENINAERKPQFLRLKKNNSNLKNHLKRVAKNIKKTNPLPAPSYKKIDSRLSDLRTQLTKTPKHKKVLPVEKLLQQDKLVLGNRTPGITLSGSFQKISNYYIISDNTEQYTKNQLVKEQGFDKLKISKKQTLISKHKTLIADVNTGAYYFVEPEFLKEFDAAKANDDLLSKPKKIKKLTQITTSYQNSNKNIKAPDNTENITYPLEKYETLILKCKDLAVKLADHTKALQSGSMTSTRSKQWKNDISEAQQLNNQIKEFALIYKRENYPVERYVNQETFDDYDHFSKALSSAIKYGGF